MTKWSEFIPDDFEYDFQNDELYNHYVTVEEAAQCFYNQYSIRKNKKYLDRFKLLGTTLWIIQERQKCRMHKRYPVRF